MHHKGGPGPGGVCGVVMMDGVDAFLRRKVESLLAEHRENDGSGSSISSPCLMLFIKKEAVGCG